MVSGFNHIDIGKLNIDDVLSDSVSETLDYCFMNDKPLIAKLEYPVTENEYLACTVVLNKYLYYVDNNKAYIGIMSPGILLIINKPSETGNWIALFGQFDIREA